MNKETDLFQDDFLIGILTTVIKAISLVDKNAELYLDCLGPRIFYLGKGIFNPLTTVSGKDTSRLQDALYLCGLLGIELKINTKKKELSRVTAIMKLDSGEKFTLHEDLIEGLEEAICRAVTFITCSYAYYVTENKTKTSYNHNCRISTPKLTFPKVKPS